MKVAPDIHSIIWFLLDQQSHLYHLQVLLLLFLFQLTILQAARMLEGFYPGHVISHLQISEADFWENKSLEFRDWTGENVVYTFVLKNTRVAHERP